MRYKLLIYGYTESVQQGFTQHENQFDQRGRCSSNSLDSYLGGTWFESSWETGYPNWGF
jgi:hypothetical protein